MTPGTEVAVLSLHRKRGEIVAEVRAGLYRVRVGTMLMTCREADLEPLAPRRRRARRQPSPDEPAVPAAESVSPEAGALRALDLHGLGVDEARNRVASHVSRAIVAGLDRIEIVHGIGTGALRRAVTAELATLPVVKQVRPHPTNPGVLIVQL